MLTRISIDFNGPIGIDHHEATNQVILSVNYPSGVPYNFELVAPDGTRTKFSDIRGLTEEVKVASVRSGPHQGGFEVGEVFCGTGVAGVVARMSPDGRTLQNPWVRLPGESGLMRGSLFQDRYGVFGGDLIVVTTAGGVWRITSAGAATRLAQLNTHLEGVTTVPDNAAKYGPWAGKIIVGAEQQNRIYAISASGQVAAFDLGIQPEDIEIIPANENFYGVDFAGRTLWGAPPSAFADMVGDVLIAQESSGILWHVRWDAATNSFVKRSLAQVGHWEHVAFSPAKLPGGPGPSNLAWLGSASILCEQPLHAAARLGDKDGKPVAGKTVMFSAAGSSATAVTDESGIARATLTVSHGVSPIVVLISFPGDNDYLPSTAQASVTVEPAEAELQYTGRPVLALGTAQQVSARLTDSWSERPITGRTITFQVGSQSARATTDTNGVATAMLTVPVAERPTEVVASFAGDFCYRPASVRAPILAYVPTSFVIWGSNPEPLALGQRVNFWGAQWAKQVRGGDYDAHAEFKGHAVLSGALRVCQPGARTTSSPRLNASCWTSKPGQSDPPKAPLPEHIGLIVATSISKDKSTIYGNIAAVVIARVDADPPYGAAPGKPGFGTLVAVVEDGEGLFPG